MRTDFNFKIKCSYCGQLLEADIDKSKLTASSAYNEEFIILIFIGFQ